MVYGIVKKCGGDITVFSEEGQGATFNVYFPLIEKDGGGGACESAATCATGKERILVVDDEAPIARLQKEC